MSPHFGDSPIYRPMAHFQLWGDGTPERPAFLTFSVDEGEGPGLEALRNALPESVILDRRERGARGFVMRGVNPAMTRVELDAIFQALVQKLNWRQRAFQ